MANTEEKIADFHVRLGRLEALISPQIPSPPDSWIESACELVTALIGIFCCFNGLGLPNHYYQYLFGIITILCLYHRGTLPFPKSPLGWGLFILNVSLTAMLFKLIIGGGEPRPLAWLSYPTIEGGLTSFKITWAAAPGSGWVLPLTSIQSFLLIISLFALMINLSLLAGLTSFMLTLLAIPTLFSFDWDWTLPGVIMGLFSLYLQAGTFNSRAVEKDSKH